MILKRTLPALALGLLLAGCSGPVTAPDEPSTPPAVDTTAPGPSTDPTTPEAEPTPSDPVEGSTPAPVESVTPDEMDNPEPPVSPDPIPIEPTEVMGEWTVTEVEVRTAADAVDLAGLPAGFEQFAADLVAGPDEGGCQSELVVTAHHPAGFVTGQEFAPGCGGSNVIWGSSGGDWGPVLSMQALLPCSELENNSIPQGHPELECLDAAGSQTSW